MEIETFNDFLRLWYAKYGRHELPWRKKLSSYHVWVAEIMLQQTQVNRVAENFYLPFLEAFPNIEKLAEVNWEQLYPYWKGLGFYGRGKNMLKTARKITSYSNGQFPQNQVELIQLPGIGKYTANAILAFAYDKAVAAIDTNICRLIKAFFPQLDVEETSTRLVEKAGGGRWWNSAAMDLASALRNQQIFEPKIEENISPQVRTAFERKRASSNTIIKDKNQVCLDIGIACIHQNGKYLIQKKPNKYKTKEVWDFPSGEKKIGENLRQCIKREIQEELGIEVSVRPSFLDVKIAHESIVNGFWHLHFHRCQIQKGVIVNQEQQIFKWIFLDQFFDHSFLNSRKEVLQRLQAFKT